ncbi:peptidyl-prolyl cis-trans isomerase A (cyclophilin A) [Sphaerotilus hippei]|uniref:Peptidyl-prolyl cis-trans isomerase n=1 Tax=Sphaerotilus hippei TaxID=744406 RepID=A0A318H5L6_9BURK|nr:peptidylprolyl isomerase [Sphaerotilus hippei]PXW98747.1 peptidyl-prolyl cis-trans isomerase A (cyclophilin A) [Sphaerotilus hippei]
MQRTKRHALILAATLGLSLSLSAPLQAQTPESRVRLSTTAGDIVIDLDPAKAPGTVANFIEYVKAGHYDGTVFHRVIPNFMVQGGGMDAQLREKPTRAPIKLESRSGLLNKRGTIAMARTGFPHSATSQFFINVKDNAFLDAANSSDGNGYAVFGQVVSGMETVDRITTVRTGAQGQHRDVPTEPILIKKASLEK